MVRPISWCWRLPVKCTCTYSISSLSKHLQLCSLSFSSGFLPCDTWYKKDVFHKRFFGSVEKLNIPAGDDDDDDDGADDDVDEEAAWSSEDVATSTAATGERAPEADVVASSMELRHGQKQKLQQPQQRRQQRRKVKSRCFRVESCDRYGRVDDDTT